MKKTIKDREAEFIKQCEPYFEEYGKVMVKDFVEYWTEIGVSDLKMRYEKEKTFGVKRRLSTWRKNDSKFNPKPTSNEVYSEKYKATKEKREKAESEVVDYSETYKAIERSKQRYLESNVLDKGSINNFKWLYENGYITDKIDNFKEVYKKTYLEMKDLTLKVLNESKPVLREEKRKKEKDIEDIENNQSQNLINSSKLEILKTYYKLK